MVPPSTVPHVTSDQTSFTPTIIARSGSPAESVALARSEVVTSLNVPKSALRRGRSHVPGKYRSPPGSRAVALPQCLTRTLRWSARACGSRRSASRRCAGAPAPRRRRGRAGRQRGRRRSREMAAAAAARRRSTTTPARCASAGSTTRTGDRWYIGRRHVEDGDGRAGGRRLAGLGRDTVLPGDARRPARPAPASPVRVQRRASSATSSRRTSTIPTRWPARAACPIRCSPSSAARAPARCATSSRRSRPSRTRSSARRSNAASSCRAVRAPARPRSGCTAPRSCCTSTEPRSSREGVLVVGPNPVFLRYISQVLPSLGETSATQTTVDGLLALRFRVRRRGPGRGRCGEGRRAHGDGDRPCGGRGDRIPAEGIVIAARTARSAST